MKFNAFNAFLTLGSIFYLIPASIQTPFIVFILLMMNTLIVSKKRVFLINSIIIFCLCIGFIIIKYIKQSFDTSLFIITLSIIPVYYFSYFKSQLSYSDFKKAQTFLTLWLFGILVQLSIFRYNGRLNMSYEINQSGSFLFLFYIISDIFRKKIYKPIIIIISFFILSRLLIVNLLLYEFIKHTKNYIKRYIIRLTYIKAFIFSFIVICIFSIWFTINLNGNIVGGGEDISRLTSFTDGSNYLRFKINTNIIINLFSGEDKNLLSYGYGDLGINNEYLNKYILMPHNEVLKGIAQYGLFFVIFCLSISRKTYNKIFTFDNIEIIFCVILYTLILWVRFFIIPSPEMIFIFFILLYKSQLKLIYESHYHNFKYLKMWGN